MRKATESVTQQAIQDAEQLLADGRFAESLAVASSITAKTDLERCRIAIIRAEAGLYLGQNEHCSLREIIEILQPRQENDLYARAKLLFGWTLVRNGQPDEAAPYLRESCVYFRRYNQSRNLRRGLSFLAQIAFQKMDLQQVEEYTRELVELAGDRPHTRALYRANLARAFIRSGLFSKASAIFGDCTPVLCEYSSASRTNYHLSMSLLNILQARYAEARSHLNEITHLSSGDASREKVIFLEYSAQLDTATGNFRRAEQTLQQALGGLTADAGDESSQVNRLLADLYVLAGQWRLAEKHAIQAVSVASAIRERTEIAACWRVMAQVENNRGHQEKAREWFEKAIELFNLICSRYELAVTRYLAATSGVYRNGERAALLYLARQYFVSERLDHWGVRVDEAVKVEPLMRKQPRSDAQLPIIICRSDAMSQVFALAEQVAQSNMTVLLTGETGTGKDLLAHYIHYHSGRPGQFVAVNCAAIAETLLESELFGHEKGAFTGAAARKPGRFELAQHGTLLLDEVAEMSPVLQAKLLRVLEERQVTRVGGVQPVSIDVRIIAATNRNLPELIAAQRFRDDLFHRLNTIPIQLPPLRDRVHDIPALVEHFLIEEGVKIGSRESDAFERLCLVLSAHEWPGNVREVRAKVQQLVVASQGDLDRMVELALGDGSDSTQERLLAALEIAGGNQSKAAALLGVSEGTVRKRLRKYRFSTS